MSGENEREPSGASVDLLRRELLAIINERDRRYEQRFGSQEAAVSAALASAEKAVEKAEMASEKRFDGVNEFRASLADATRNNLTRTEADARFGNSAEKLADLSDRVKGIESASGGRQDVWKAVAAIVSALAAVAVVALGVVAATM